MEQKKSPKADLNNLRPILLEIGLICALALVIGAFMYTPKEHRIMQVEQEYGPIEEEITEITRQDEKMPEPPQKVEVKVITDLLQVVTNDTKVEMDIDFAEFNEDMEVIQHVEIVEEILEEEIFFTAETMPSFQGGTINDFRNWVQRRVEYPVIAQENGIAGTVVLSFVIEKDGKLTNIKVLRSPDRSLGDEAVRVLKQSPRWSPGKQRNQSVRVSYTLPIVFRIQ